MVVVSVTDYTKSTDGPPSINICMKKKYIILFCEDEEFVARSYTRKLELEGYTVVRACNGNEAIELLQETVPDLILLDLMMPGKSGFDVLKHVRKGENKQLKKVPVIVASNLGQQSDVDEAMELGANDFIVKSNISLKELAKKISNYLSKRK